MNTADFLRTYTMRSPNVMWFLGAGASAAAGIPTAYHMIWDFKRTIYCAAQRVSIETCSDLGSSVLRTRLQQYFDSVGGYPGKDSEDEYAYYFEHTYPDEGDRRRYIDSLVSGASPSYGHLALAALLKLEKARLVWTTNFDPMIEDSATALFGSSGKLTTATLDMPQLAMEAMNEGRWPLLVKLHGDFRSRRLKNTVAELRKQDVELRRALTESCRRYGLAVTGYSGRDNSVMDALEEAVDGGKGYPFGLFWFHRSDSPPLPRVSKLVNEASNKGIDAHLIEVETFDELLADVLLLQKVPSDVVELLGKQSRRVSNAPLPGRGKKWPVLRLNALPITSAPTVCRRVVCKVGGIKEVRRLVTESKAEVIATRRQVGVLAFGSDSEVRRAFADHSVTEFDLHNIEAHRLRYESAELGLLYEALSRALERERPLKIRRRGPYYLVVIHKSTEFKDEEIDGCFDVWRMSEGLDLVQVQQNALWRAILINPQNKGRGVPDKYPCHRGSYLQLGGRDILLWTQGNAPSAVGGRNFFKEGKGIPAPLLLTRFAGHGAWDDGCRAVLGLTKMNWNNDSLYDRLPVTLGYAHTLARTIKRMPQITSQPYEFRFFM